ncbi:MAG: Bug family tripartite tricarboxylate transporter substrate binding protein [Burkholderiales bacterium]
MASLPTAPHVRALVRAVAVSACAVALGSAAFDASAQAYPAKPIRIIVPFAAGGPTDLVGRALTDKLTVYMRQPFVFDNRGGAGSVVGSDAVAKAAPDGYTWLLSTGSLTSIGAFNPNVPFDPLRDFTPVTIVAKNFGQILIVHPGVPAKNLKELLALAKAQPGKLNYAAAGIGNITYIAAEMMKAMTGLKIADIQYKGMAPAMNELMGGHVDMAFAPTQTAIGMIQSGKVHAIALTGPARWKVLPNVPTMSEAGLPGYELVGWFALWLPPATPAPIVKRVYSETVRALGEPDVKQRFDEVGLEADGRTPEAFAQFMKKDVAEMHALARKIGIAAK